jgi:hypothetical protein
MVLLGAGSPGSRLAMVAAINRRRDFKTICPQREESKKQMPAECLDKRIKFAMVFVTFPQPIRTSLRLPLKISRVSLAGSSD